MEKAQFDCGSSHLANGSQTHGAFGGTEAIVVAFRKHTLLPLDDCLYALQATIPQLTRSSLHRCLERHGISRLPEVEGDKPRTKKFDNYPIGFFHIDLAEVRTAEGKLYLFVAIDRTSKYVVVELVAKANMQAAAAFLEGACESCSVLYSCGAHRQWNPIRRSSPEPPGTNHTLPRTSLRPSVSWPPNRTPAHQA